MGQQKPSEKYPGGWLPDENHRVVFLLLVVKRKEDHSNQKICQRMYKLNFK
jgi:hypothetical protein